MLPKHTKFVSELSNFLKPREHLPAQHVTAYHDVGHAWQLHVAHVRVYELVYFGVACRPLRRRIHWCLCLSCGPRFHACASGAAPREARPRRRTRRRLSCSRASFRPATCIPRRMSRRCKSPHRGTRIPCIIDGGYVKERGGIIWRASRLGRGGFASRRGSVQFR